MGYYTSHSFKIPMKPELIAVFRDECDQASYSFDDDGNPEENSKWYDQEDDMKRFSAKHPGIVMVAEGIGEDPTDRWREYYMDGKMQNAKVRTVYDEFDPNKLGD
jgi:hypothetical protein